AAGRVVSAVHGNTAYAVVPVQLSSAEISAGLAARAAPARQLARAVESGATPVVVVTRTVPGPVGSWYFAVAAAGTLLVAMVVADRLGRRISRPLAEVESTARRIADGDLDGRASVRRGDYPELASLGASINTMTESLARAKGLERQFLMSVSHDLRTPLTSIRGWAEAITDGATDDVRAANIIGAEAQRLQRLVQDLLDLAKLDARSFSVMVRPADVVAPVRAAVESLRPAADEAGLRLDVDVPEAPVSARVDPDRLMQVVGNLIDNAYKYAAAGIRVWVGTAPGAVAVAVEDDGPGIGAEDVDHVFDRLYQSARTSARPGGSGLGLAIVKELTEAMGGRVRVESPATPRGGTRIVLTLPPDDTPVSGWSTSSTTTS
ncbi:MAG TPA: HAMP domain-containing sensor histidine kinase, partial [Acidimicrobiales bacterium]|nr:HAMP domain-containing sensor histidine kinase [Acidimicrobiales bacterium]